MNWFKDNPLTIIMGIGYWHPSKGGTPHRKDEHMACDVEVRSLEELLMLKALKKLQISTSGRKYGAMVLCMGKKKMELHFKGS